MQQQDIEVIYEELATGIDAAGEADAEIFLAQVCLLLARELSDKDRTLELVQQALRPHQDKAITSAE